MIAFPVLRSNVSFGRRAVEFELGVVGLCRDESLRSLNRYQEVIFQVRTSNDDPHDDIINTSSSFGHDDSGAVIHENGE
jgi:hypothetical protein